MNAGDLNLLICGGFFSLLFGGVGLMLLIIRNKDHRQAEESKNWPVAIGTITKSELGWADDGRTSYFPIVEYSYAVGDQHFEGKRIFFGPVLYHRFSQPVEELIAHFEPGEEVKVYYNPQKPKEAVLQSRVAKAKLGLAVPIILIGIGVLILLAIITALLWMVLSG